jgi:alpha-ketoglutarate-dependent 2,4-dichlorophenoxyacetate dioxygenase
MKLNITPLHPVFAAEITGVNLAKPFDEDVLVEIVAAMDTYTVCVFPGQLLSDEMQIAFSRRLGPLETTRKANRPGYKHRLDLHVSDISNLGLDNKILPRENHRRMNDLGNRMWHTDSSFKRTPAKYSLLSARTIPDSGGETQVADLRAAYDALPDRKKQEIEGLVAMHSVMLSRAKIGFIDFTPEEQKSEAPVPQVIVRIHPGSGRKTLYLASHAGEIVGMPLPEGRMLLNDLIDHATQPQFVYTHTWRENDLVIWDDRCSMHRAREYDVTVVRDMHRTTVADDAPTVEQAKVV